MGRVKRGGYLIEWWIGDHLPRHVHVYKGGKEVVKIELPEFTVLKGKMSAKLKKILMELIKEGKV